MIRFASKGWRKWVETYVRPSSTVHLFTGGGADPTQLQEIERAAGYAPIKLMGGAWAYTEMPGVVTATYPDVTWRFTGSLLTDVTGWFVRDAEGDIYYWEDAFADEPFKIRARRVLDVGLCIQVATDI